jgi:hypothetical protein
MDEFETYIAEPVAPVRRGRRGRGLSVYLGVAVLLAAASLVAVNYRGGAAAKLRLIHPRDGGCAVPFTKSVTDGAGVTTTLNLCISQEGNITSLFYPDTSASHQQISFDAYCLADLGQFTNTWYNDFGGAPGVPASSGFGPATITGGPNSNPIVVTRSTTDGKFQLQEYIAVNFVPRSIAVIVSIKNTSGSARTFAFERAVAPKVDGNASDDQYNVYGISGFGRYGTTGQAFQSPGPGTDEFAIAVASKDGTYGPTVVSETLADWQSGANGGNGCNGSGATDPGYVAGGNRVFEATAAVFPTPLANGATARITYDIRMM